MGRAIDMEKDIDILKGEVKKLKDILKEILDEVQEDEKLKKIRKKYRKNIKEKNNG